MLKVNEVLDETNERINKNNANDEDRTKNSENKPSKPVGGLKKVIKTKLRNLKIAKETKIFIYFFIFLFSQELYSNEDSYLKRT